MKNKWGKAIKVGKAETDAYYKIEQGGWAHYVLKVYGDPRKPYARAFCKVTSPATGPSGDLGDVYCKEIPGLAAAWVKAHTEEPATA